MTLSTMGPGDYLSSGQFIVANNGSYFAVSQTDGNFCIYQGTPQNQGPLVWQTATAGAGASVMIMQLDGNLCLYVGNSPADMGGLRWQSETAGGGDSYCRMQSDGNMCVYSQGGHRWGSNT